VDWGRQDRRIGSSPPWDFRVQTRNSGKGCRNVSANANATARICLDVSFRGVVLKMLLESGYRIVVNKSNAKATAGSENRKFTASRLLGKSVQGKCKSNSKFIGLWTYVQRPSLKMLLEGVWQNRCRSSESFS
jgi:hypothetical protein